MPVLQSGLDDRVPGMSSRFSARGLLEGTERLSHAPHGDDAGACWKMFLRICHQSCRGREGWRGRRCCGIIKGEGSP
jgi:hypothetical protein